MEMTASICLSLSAVSRYRNGRRAESMVMGAVQEPAQGRVDEMDHIFIIGAVESPTQQMY